MSNQFNIDRQLALRIVTGDFNAQQSAVAELRALLAAPVVERQRNQCDGCQAGKPIENGNRHRMSNGPYPDFMACTAKLYTSPPAPVAVVLPERREASYYADGNYSAADLAAIWNAAIMATASMNACLDKVKEMNNG